MTTDSYKVRRLSSTCSGSTHILPFNMNGPEREDSIYTSMANDKNTSSVIMKIAGMSGNYNSINIAIDNLPDRKNISKIEQIVMAHPNDTDDKFVII